MNKTKIFAVGIIISSFLIGIYFYPQMPAQVASHWDTLGNVNGYMSKFWGIFMIPIISTALFILFNFIPRIDPLGKNIQSFKKQFDNFILILIAFMAYIELFVILWNLGFTHINAMQFLTPAMAILFFYMGVLLKNAKQNWFVGIRTPWTLSSKKVWNKTHNLGSRLFKLSAAIALVGMLFPKYAFLFVIIPIISSSIFLMIYSYVEFRKENKGIRK